MSSKKANGPPAKAVEKASGPPKFELSKSLRNRLPSSERETGSKSLWAKAAGKCRLCGRALDPGDAEPDHSVPESAGGTDELSNLYLAHKACNRSRGNLSLALAEPIVEFRAFSSEVGAMTFDHVLERYVRSKDKGAPKPIEFHDDGLTARIVCDGQKFDNVLLSTDPATKVKYFFLEVPVTCIYNDKDVQPRLIGHNHVRALTLDFAERPVHEPSNCRLEFTSKNVGRLLQFDGQHKSTAQILLGRTTVPMKVYVAPEKAMVQQLVLKIQQEIKKQPLTRSDTLAKLGDVIKRRLDEYSVKLGEIRTESGFVNSQPAVDRKVIKKDYFQELQRLVFYDDTNELAKLVKPGRASAPATDRVVIDKIIAPLLWSELLTTDMDQPGGRDIEREQLILILNAIAGKMLPAGWEKNELKRERAKLFFQQGAISYWSEELKAALRLVAMIGKANEPLLIERAEQKVRDGFIGVAEALCDWDVWSTNDEKIVTAIRSNTAKNVREAMKGFGYDRLIRDYHNRT